MTDEFVETGLSELVTATVTPAPDPTPPPAPMPEGWTIHRVAAFVRDVAMNLYDLPFTLKKHGLSEEEYATLSNNEYFKRALEAATLEWNSPQSTNKRLALEAAIALEDALPDVAARLKCSKEPLTGVVALAQLLAKMAGVGEGKPNDGAPQERFKITINLGADTFQAEKARGPVIRLDQEPTAIGLPAPVRTIP